MIFVWFFDVAVAAPTVTSGHIVCRESSLSGPEKAELEIVRKGGGYSDGKREIDAARVAELAAALQMTPVAALKPEELVPPAEALQQAAQRWAQSRSARPAQRKALQAAIADHAKVVEAVRAHWRSKWTDDYPQCEILLVVDSKRNLLAGSAAQQAFMIPWKLGTAESWTPRIGRALSALLPEKFLQRERLSGSRMAEIVVDELGRFIQ